MTTNETPPCVFVADMYGNPCCTTCGKPSYQPVPAGKGVGDMEWTEMDQDASLEDIRGGRARDCGDAAYRHAQAKGFPVECCETAHDRAHESAMARPGARIQRNTRTSRA